MRSNKQLGVRSMTMHRMTSAEKFAWVLWPKSHWELARRCTKERVGVDWTPPVIVPIIQKGLKRRPLGDRPWNNWCDPFIFSGRAIDAVRHLLPASTEILPTISEHGEFWCINVLERFECFDPKNALAEQDPEFFTWDVERGGYAFVPDRLAIAPPIFYEPQVELVLMTQAFADAVSAAKLKGFELELIWALDGSHKLGIEPHDPSMGIEPYDGFDDD